MLCVLIAGPFAYLILIRFRIDRYAIDDTSTDWSVAEAQVASLANGGPGKSTVVSVKSTVSGGATKKRKSAEDDAPVGKGEKKSGARRSIKKAKRS